VVNFVLQSESFLAEGGNTVKPWTVPLFVCGGDQMYGRNNLTEFVAARLDAETRGTLAALARLERVSLSEALRRSIVLAGDMALGGGVAGGGHQVADPTQAQTEGAPGA